MKKFLSDGFPQIGVFPDNCAKIFVFTVYYFAVVL